MENISLHPIQLIVGLANPGKEYAETRHNAGAWFVEELAQFERTTLRFETKYHSLHSKIETEYGVCHLLIPTTFMNLSGRAVRACMQYYKIPLDAVLIAHDDIDLPVGAIKLKFDGGDGGHNGLKDIIQSLNSKQFYRLRIGIGHPGKSKEVADYVLAPPSKADRKKIDESLQLVHDVLPFIFSGQMQKAMQTLHTEQT